MTKLEFEYWVETAHLEEYEVSRSCMDSDNWETRIYFKDGDYYKIILLNGVPESEPKLVYRRKRCIEEKYYE